MAKNDGPLRLFQHWTVIGPNQHIIMQTIYEQPGITTPKIKQMPEITSPSGIYSLQQNGLIYSKRAQTKNASCWFPTKLGYRYLETYEALKVFNDFTEYRTWKAQQGEEKRVASSKPEPVNGSQTIKQVDPADCNHPHAMVAVGRCLACQTIVDQEMYAALH